MYSQEGNVLGCLLFKTSHNELIANERRLLYLRVEEYQDNCQNQ